MTQQEVYSYVLTVLRVSDKIESAWIEDDILHIHCNCRSGLFYIQLTPYERADFLACVGRLDNLPKTETIYRFIEVSETSNKNQYD